MSRLDKFATSSMRGPRRGIYQQLLATLMAKAVKTNEPLEKIQALCEAAYTCRIKDKLDMTLVDVCYDVCVSFRNSKKQKIYGASFVRVSWSFESTEENWKHYIQPWNRKSATYIAWFTPLSKRLYPEETEYHPKYGKAIHEELCSFPEHERFFTKTTALLPHSFNALQGEFTSWALKQLLEIQAVLSDEIDPKVWSEAIGSPEIKEGENTDENQMG